MLGPQLQNIVENVSSPGIPISRFPPPIKPPTPTSVNLDIPTENIRSEPIKTTKANVNDKKYSFLLKFLKNILESANKQPITVNSGIKETTSTSISGKNASSPAIIPGVIVVVTSSNGMRNIFVDVST